MGDHEFELIIYFFIINIRHKAQFIYKLQRHAEAIIVQHTCESETKHTQRPHLKNYKSETLHHKDPTVQSQGVPHPIQSSRTA
jgi:hypothetical protein